MIIIIIKLFHGLDTLQAQLFMSEPLPTVNTGINRFSRLLSLNTLYYTFVCSGYVASFLLGLHPNTSGVKVLIDHFWFSLRHFSARPKMMPPDTQQPLRNEDKPPQPPCQHADSQLKDQSSNSSFLLSPFSPASPQNGRAG